MHYYQFNIADYRKDTAHLSPIEHYIYRTLIDWYYLDEQPIPKETQSVTRRLRLETEQEANLKNVLLDFFVLEENGWHHKRIDMEIREYDIKCGKNKENGKRGGRPKKTQSVNFANPNESESNPNHKPITNNHKPSFKEKKKKENPLRKLLPDISEKTFNDFVAHRKNKKALITETAVDELKRQAEKANISLETALIECCSRGWTGFKAEWYLKTPARGPTSNSPQGREEFNRQQTEIAKQKLFGNQSQEKDITNEARAL